MVYHLRNAMSLRDLIATKTTGAWLVDDAIKKAGLKRNRTSNDTSIERTLDMCANSMTPEGVEKCMVINIEDFISNAPTPNAVDEFLRSIDYQIERLDKQLYDEHKV